MIHILGIFLLLSGVLFFILRKFRMRVRLLLAALAFLFLSLLFVWMLSQADDIPREGSRVVTPEELEESARTP